MHMQNYGCFGWFLVYTDCYFAKVMCFDFMITSANEVGEVVIDYVYVFVCIYIC